MNGFDSPIFWLQSHEIPPVDTIPNGGAKENKFPTQKENNKCEKHYFRSVGARPEMQKTEDTVCEDTEQREKEHERERERKKERQRRERKQQGQDDDSNGWMLRA